MSRGAWQSDWQKVADAIAKAADLLRECRDVMETEGFDREVQQIDAWLASNAPTVDAP